MLDQDHLFAGDASRAPIQGRQARRPSKAPPPCYTAVSTVSHDALLPMASVEGTITSPPQANTSTSQAQSDPRKDNPRIAEQRNGLPS